MHIILGIIFLLVAILAVVSVIRQLKFKNMFALAFSGLTALAFGFFAVATIISEIAG
jgi:di/tricarboxylate transporter